MIFLNMQAIHISRQHAAIHTLAEPPHQKNYVRSP